MQRAGTSYYLASLFFPHAFKQRIFLLYAFVRIADDIVDQPPYLEMEQAIDQVHQYAQHVYHRQPTGETSLLTTQQQEIVMHAVDMLRSYMVPREWIDAFFIAMKADTTSVRMHTYQELQRYMHGSAEVIGRMVVQLYGKELEVPAQQRMPLAAKLGEAMQYTNFLRDVGEDYGELWRIYMPSERLARHQLTHEDIATYTTTKTVDGRWQAYMQDEVRFARELYAQAQPWIAYLPADMRTAVALAAHLYENILDRIVYQQYNVFARPARTTAYNKATTIGKFFLSRIWWR